jgi:hypothetical protein
VAVARRDGRNRRARRRAPVEVGGYDSGLFFTLVGALAGPLLFTLQSNGIVEINWIWSVLTYVLVAASFVYAFWKWETPLGWGSWRFVVLGLSILILASLSLAGVSRQYRREHVVPDVSIPLTLASEIRDRSGGLWLLREDYAAPINAAAHIRITNKSADAFKIKKVAIALKDDASGKWMDLPIIYEAGSLFCCVIEYSELDHVHGIQLDDGGLSSVIQSGGLAAHRSIDGWLLAQFPAGFSLRTKTKQDLRCSVKIVDNTYHTVRGRSSILAELNMGRPESASAPRGL